MESLRAGSKNVRTTNIIAHPSPTQVHTYTGSIYHKGELKVQNIIFSSKLFHENRKHECNINNFKFEILNL